MSIFDLIFILAFVTSLVTIAAASIALVRGHRTKGLNLLRVWGLCAAGYFACGLALSYLRPQRVVVMGTPWCFDEWCLTVAGVERTAGVRTSIYRIHLQLSSQARRKAQRANGAWIYLIDDRGRRYAPEPNSSEVPLDALLLPSQSITAERTFKTPPEIRGLGLVTGHGGPYCGAMDLLVIGSAGCLFGKETMIRIQ